MPMAQDKIEKGAYIEQALDDNGRLLKVRRRGYIVKVLHHAGEGNPLTEERTGMGIAQIWVQFEEGAEPELVHNRNINLVRPCDAVAAGRIRQEEQNAIGQRVVGGFDQPVVMDRTGVETKVPISEADFKKHRLKAR